MSDRKESLLRTIKLQNEQLEQWEKKRTTSGDPDEKLRCDDKISDIKALIKQNEEELKKLKGGRTKEKEKEKAKEEEKEKEPVPPAVKPSVQHNTYNPIGFNAHKSFSENKSDEDITDSLHYIGDKYESEQPKVGQGTVASVASTGNPPTGSDRPVGIIAPGSSSSNNKISIRFEFLISAILTVGILILALMINTNKELIDFVKIIGGCVVCLAIILTIYHPSVPDYVKPKFAFSLIVISLYICICFWERTIFGKGDNAKTFGELVFFPLLTGVILLVVEQVWKRGK